MLIFKIKLRFILTKNYCFYICIVRTGGLELSKKNTRRTHVGQNYKYTHDATNRFTMSITRANPPPDFFVPPHPLIALLIPYGLLLTFSSALFPDNIPPFIPLGELAKYLGNEYSSLMQFVALFAATVHVAYPFYIITLSLKYQFMFKQTLLWVVNGFFFGIFSIWPLIFYDFYLENKTTYCNIPLAIC